MYQLEYLFYHLRPFQDGGEVGNRPPKSSENPFFTFDFGPQVSFADGVVVSGHDIGGNRFEATIER